MISRRTKAFKKLLAALPKDVQQRAESAYRVWKTDPHYPGIRFKKVHATDPIYSVRIDLDCRAVGVLRGDAMIWFWVGKHAEYEKLLKSL